MRPMAVTLARLRTIAIIGVRWSSAAQLGISFRKLILSCSERIGQLTSLNSRLRFAAGDLRNEAKPYFRAESPDDSPGTPMSELLLIARLSLAAIFLISAGAKTVDFGGFRRSLSEFGLPRFALQPVAVTIPLVELAIAVGLIAVSTAWVAALLAVTLLIIFTVAIALNMAKGRRPDCRCFGQLSSQPIG